MRYRHWTSDHPSDSVSAEFMERALLNAQAVTRALAQNESETFRRTADRIRTALFSVAFVMIAIAIVFVIRMFSAQAGY